jgi:DNA-binding transcriptional MerR regulator
VPEHGQAAERTGLSAHALRFYEREGLLAAPVQRTADGRRAYSEPDLEWLELCVKLRSSGMPLAATASTPNWSGREQATSKTGSPSCAGTKSA